MSRPARGAWVEICVLALMLAASICRAPQGARGLKFRHCAAPPRHQQSRPARGAWVEILTECWGLGYVVVAPRKGRVG